MDGYYEDFTPPAMPEDWDPGIVRAEKDGAPVWLWVDQQRNNGFGVYCHTYEDQEDRPSYPERARKEIKEAAWRVLHHPLNHDAREDGVMLYHPIGTMYRYRSDK